MHYYKFNIADWALHTSHLNLWEEAIYFRLINFYYDTEKPIPLELNPIIRRLRLDLSTGDLENVLNEFFVETDSGYIHKRCEEILKEYRKTNKKNKANGAKGGRPPKTKGSEITQTEPSGLIKETQTKGNQELVTKNYELGTRNQEPLTKNQEQKTKEIKHLSSKHDDDAKGIFDYWCSVMNTGKSKFSKERKDKVLARLKDGYTVEEIKRAIFNCSNTPHNMGQNNNGKKYNDIELICRKSTQLEGFRDNPGTLNNSFGEKTQQNAGMFKDFLENNGEPRNE